MLGLKLLIFSDIHNDWKTLARLMDVEADFYIAAGDLVSWSLGLPGAGEILSKRAEQVYVIPGNHETETQVSSLCARFGLHDLHGRHMELGGWQVAGLGYSNPTPFNTPGEFTEAQLAERLERFAELKRLILVCHAPPFGTALDEMRPGQHGGSTAVRDFIKARQPEYFFCGHIHEAAGRLMVMGNTRARNVGRNGYLLEVE